MGKKKQDKPNPSKAKVGFTKSKGPFEKPVFWLMGILLLTFIVFSASLKNGFTNWDDNIYISENAFIKDLSVENTLQIFDTENHVSLNYHPLTILSLALDYKISGYQPKAYHLTNLLFHLFNTALVFWFIYLLSGKKIMVASIVAFFFGIHPMHVESVAWISERKDVLYTFFFLAALLAYQKYLEVVGKKKILVYCLILFLFLLSLLSKAMAVVLPLIFLLVDYYKQRKLDKYVILEKIPFFAMSLYFGLLASRIQSAGAAIASFETFTWLQRLSFASYGMINYIYKLFVPAPLSCFYPYPHLIEDRLPYLFYVCPALVLALFMGVAYYLKKNRSLVFGFLFFFISIALVLQFVSVGQVIMADRYTYLPYIGLLFPVAMGVDWLRNKGGEFKRYQQLTSVILIVASVLSMVFTFKRTKVWKNSDVLWTDAIQKYPDSEAAYRNRGSYLINKEAYDLGEKTVGPREVDRALKDFDISINLNPISAKVFTNRANIYGLKGRYDLALSDYSKAIELDNTDEQTFFNRAITYSMMKQYEKAIEDYSAALMIKPDFIRARESRAYSYVDNENLNLALSELNALVKINENNSLNYFYRGLTNFKLGNTQDAISDNTLSIKLNPTNKEAYFNRSFMNRTLGEYKGALEDALKAKSLGFSVNDDYLNDLKNRLK